MDFGSKMTVARIGGPDGDLLSREVQRSMPIAHAKNTDVPMLLVYSTNDRITRPTEVLTYAKAVGKDAIAVPVQCEGHGAVPDAGFKLALAWLLAQTKRNADNTNEITLVSHPVVDPAEQSPTEQSEDTTEETPQPIPQLPVQTRLPRHPTLNPAGIQQNPYIAD
jgi:hypothetical protein